MKKKSTKQLIGNSVSMLVFLTGAFVGVALLVISVWADMEAALFDSSIRGERAIRSMNCPIMITTSEAGEVQAFIHQQS